MPELPVVEKAQPIHSGSGLIYEHEVARERLGWEETVTALKKEKEELKQKIKEAAEKNRLIAGVAGESWDGLFRYHEVGWAVKDEYKAFIRSQSNLVRNPPKEDDWKGWNKIWWEWRSAFVLTELIKLSEELLGLSK